MSRTFDIGKFADKWIGDMPALINLIADAVRIDVEKGITTSKDTRNKPFKRLKAATIKAKKRKGSAYPSRPLEDTGAMKRVYVKQRASKSKPEAIITMPKKAEYGVYHPPKREWFGISTRADKKIHKLIQRWMATH